MDTINELQFLIACRSCGTEESASMLDTGDRWSGTWWQSEPCVDPTHFAVTWSGGGKQEPAVRTALCKKCGTKADADGTLTTVAKPAR